MKMKRGAAEQTGYAFIMAFLILFSLTTLYPFWHVLMYSISDSRAAMTGGLFFLPRQPTLLSYSIMLKGSQIYVAYGNTVLRTLVGTVLSIIITSLTAYPLSIRRLHFRNFLSLLIFFTMLFSGGMIPTFLIVQQLGLINTFWALVIPGMMSAYNMFILRNYFQQLPAELEESAFIDGASPLVVLLRIILPVSKPALAAIALFYGIGHWNAYLDCILYTNTDKLQVLQVYIRSLMTAYGSMNSVAGLGGSGASRLTEETVRMTTIAISVIPILFVYPFLQRYYTKGILVGAVKG